MLPESGGFLEAIPLTAFVALSLINSGFADTEVVKKGIQFLKRTQRLDGGWPIDVDLSTWVTSLSVKAYRITSYNVCYTKLLRATRIAPPKSSNFSVSVVFPASG